MSDPQTDRNLLFGVLALQMDFIDRDALIAAMNAWVLEKSKPLGQILVDQGALPTDSHSVLDAVVVKHLQLHEGNAEKSLASLAPLGQLHDDLQRIADPDVQASLAPLSVARSQDVDLGPTLLFSAGPTTSSESRFHVIRPHAHGGLGEVFVALDAELNREVALKEISRTLDSDRELQSRFVREAEITGRLEHPGIVPVYGMGRYADGRPYYAMRFVKGQSLKDAIAQFHAAGHRSAGGRMLKLRGLLGRFIDVCNTVEYAHSRGVLHRDLKPSNIMLGKYGETLVVDWGLAKARGERRVEANETEVTLVPSSGSGTSETLPGSAVGTPAYMSPEQAAGRLTEIAPASDIYSLGATLYTLLTGRPPFESADVGGMLTKVQNGEFLPPRDCNRSIPAQLSAICLKAMSLKPQHRYSSCHALAADIEHWLADEPVSVYPDPLLTHIARWIKRHRGLAAATAALLVAAVIGLSVGTILLGRAKSQIESQRDIANQQREIAEEQRDLATRQLYVAQMNVADSAWNDNHVGRVRELLEAQTPEHTGGIDYRGWEWHYLWRLSHSELRTLNFRSLCLAFTPDGQHLIAGSNDGTLKWWNAAGTRQVRSIKAHDGRIQRIAIDRDGRLLATGSTDGTVKLWETATGTEMRTFAIPREMYYGMALSPDGTRLAIANSGRITFWDVPSGKQVHVVEGHQGFITALAFSPDGSRLASGAGHGTVKLWNVTTGRALRTLSGHVAGVRAVAFSPDGRLLAAGSYDGMLKSWEVGTGQETVEFKGHRQEISGLAFSPDGRRLASSSSDATVKIWDAATGREVQTLRGHTTTVADVAFSPSGAVVASGGWDGTIRLWDAASRQEPWSLPHPGTVTSVNYSPDGKYLAASGGETTAVFDASTGMRLWVEREPLTRLSGTSGTTPTLLRFDPESRVLAIGLVDGRVHLRDATHGRVLQTLNGHTDGVTSIAFSPHGRTLATGSVDRRIILWDLVDGQRLAVLEGHQDIVTNVVFRPDGKHLASTGSEDDKTVRLWNVATGREVRSFVGHDNGVYCVVFSRDGRTIFSSGRDETIRVWDVETGESIAVKRAHSGTVRSLSLSPDGSRLASASSDQTVKIWDVATVQELQILKPKVDVSSVAFSPDGTRLAAGLPGQVVVWDARPLTADLRTKLAASDLVKSLLARQLATKDVIETLKADATISDSVRERALELARQKRAESISTQ